MTRPFKKPGAVSRYFLIKSIVKHSYWSRHDGCMVTPMKCAKCGGMYDEELQAARLKVIEGRLFMCLSCDDKGGRIRDIRAVRFVLWIG